MARTVASLPAGSRIADYISLGVIAKYFPSEKVQAVLEQTGRASERERERDLPAHVVVDCCTCGRLSVTSFAVCWKECSGRWTHRLESKSPANRVFRRVKVNSGGGG